MRRDDEVYSMAVTEARLKAARALERWGLAKEFGYNDNTSYSVLSRLLGYKNRQDMFANYNPDHTAVMEAIGGIHGWAIYKALKVRQNEES